MPTHIFFFSVGRILAKLYPFLARLDEVQEELFVTHKAVRPGARSHVPPVMAEGDFRLMTQLYDN